MAGQEGRIAQDNHETWQSSKATTTYLIQCFKGILRRWCWNRRARVRFGLRMGNDQRLHISFLLSVCREQGYVEVGEFAGFLYQHPRFHIAFIYMVKVRRDITEKVVYGPAIWEGGGMQDAEEAREGRMLGRTVNEGDVKIGKKVGGPS
jgi:hypothetical protein